MRRWDIPWRSAIASIALLSWAPAPALGAEGDALAVLPVQDSSGADVGEVEYLTDVLRQEVLGSAPPGTRLAPGVDVMKALGRSYSSCGEACAARVGREVGAGMVVLVELRMIRGEYKATVKLVESASGSLVGMEMAAGADLDELETALGSVVGGLFGAPEEEPRPAEDEDEVPMVSPWSPRPEAAAERPYWGDLEVLAKATWASRPDEPARPVAATVEINGRVVGRTPYRDGLPAGVYVISVEYGGEKHATEEVLISPGERHLVEGEFEVPLTPGEIEAKRKELRAELRAQWDADVSEWEKERAEADEQRIQYLASGLVVGFSGAALAVAGVVLEVYAKEEHDDYSTWHDEWISETDEDEIARMEAEMNEAKESRDTYNAWGIACLVVGGGALAAGIVVLAVMPDLPEKPAPPEGYESSALSDLRLGPLFGDEVVGLSLSARF